MTPQFKTLGDYIRWTEQQEEQRRKDLEQAQTQQNQYLVYPELQGEEDRPRNAYSQS